MKNKVALLVLIAPILLATILDGEEVKLQYPENWPEPTYDFEKNPLTISGIELGRHLFYDPILSADSSISCANCHLSYTAFTHVDHSPSHGIRDSVGTRNSMTIINLAWSKSFFWDGAVNHLDMQPMAPITHPAEMGADFSDVVEKVGRSEVYQDRFEAAFGTREVTGELFLKAIAQFQLTLISANSRFDKIMREEPGFEFTAQEANGFELFILFCNFCHQAPLFTDGEFHNIGLPVDPDLLDTGRMGITQNSEDSIKFKTPTLRNVEFSRPYMHDGRFETLREVLQHYRGGVVDSDNVALEVIGGIELSPEDEVDLIAFLLTLSDREFLFDPKHAFPRN